MIVRLVPGLFVSLLIIAPSWIAAGKLMNQIFHPFVEDLYVTATTPNQIVDVLVGLIFRKRLQLIANTYTIGHARLVDRNRPEDFALGEVTFLWRLVGFAINLFMVG